MPHVQVTCVEGRTPEQKRAIAEGMTQVLLEGIARQVLTDTSLRYAIALFAILLWAAYFYLPRGEAKPERD